MPDSVSRSSMCAQGEGQKQRADSVARRLQAGVYSSRIPRANQYEQNPPPQQSKQKPQQK